MLQNNLLQEAYRLIGTEKDNKRRLWQLAFETKKNFGSRGLRELSRKLEHTFNETKSYNTLRQYAYIYEVIQIYNVPKDLPYTIIRAIASCENPQELVDLIKEKGLNSHDIMKIIKSTKPKKEKFVKCPKCGNEFIPNT